MKLIEVWNWGYNNVDENLKYCLNEYIVENYI